MPTLELLDQLVEQVLSSAKYRLITSEVIRNIGARELAKRASLKEAVKTTRNKLHQVGSAYQEQGIPYARWMEELQALSDNLADESVRAWLLEQLPAHASTRERVSILPHFYSTVLASLPPVRSVLDLACGLNPLTLPWMDLPGGCTYTAVDIYEDLRSFLDVFLFKFHIPGRSICADLTQTLPPIQADLTLLLKTIPSLEQVDKQAGARLLAQITSPYLLVSFPAHSLGGKSKGMVQNYEQHFMELTITYPWKITRFEFPGELAFLVQK